MFKLSLPSMLTLTIICLMVMSSFALYNDTSHEKYKTNKNHRLFKRSENGNEKPDFHAKYADMNLESKLANIKLGRHRRDENEAKKDIESAELRSAAAAIYAEQAKENALEAFEDDEKVEKDEEKMEKDIKQFHTNSRTKENSKTDYSYSKISSENDESSDSIKSQGSVQNNVEYYDDNENSNQMNEYNNDENDDDEDMAEETVVDDGVATIVTSISHDQSSSKTGTNLTRKDNHTTVNNINSGLGSQVCQDLLDLKSMSQDFRKRLQTLIDREEQVVEKLDQIKKKMEKTAENLQDFEQNIRKQRTVEPSEACVYIEEDVSSNEEHKKTGGEHRKQKVNLNHQHQQTNHKNSDNIQNGNRHEIAESQVHVYTSEGRLPSAKENSDVHQSSTEFNQSSKSKKKFTRESEIDLENIYWIKPDEHDTNHDGNYDDNLSSKSKGVLQDIEKDGHDALIIPISSKYRSTRDVAKTILNTMNRRSLSSDRREKNKRKKFRLVVHRI